MTAMVFALLAGAADSQASEVLYSGPCDASAAVAIGADEFVVANDETNSLYRYRRGAQRAIGALDASKFLHIRGGDEADLEGAAAIGARIYWIASHGRSDKGKVRASRHRFFATELRADPSQPLVFVGKPYTHLLRDLTDAPTLARYQFAAAARRGAEAAGGFNIEGLAATPEGGLLIGLRNPLFEGRALAIPMSNPDEVVGGSRARFGQPFELDLDGRGIRSIELVGAAYLIVAGPTANAGSFALYRWSGKRADAPQRIESVTFGTLRPEALFAIPQTDRVQLLSDDGGVETGGVECKRRPKSEQAFRSVIVTP